MFPSVIQSIDFSKTEQSILSIRISTSGFYFSIYNPISSTPYYFFKSELDRKKSIVANFKELVTDNPFLSQLYKRVNIVLTNTKSILHPLHLFDNKLCQELFFYGQKSQNSSYDVLYNELAEANQAIIFGVNNVLYKFLQTHFSRPNIYSQTTCLLNYFNKLAKENNCKSLFIYFENDQMQLYAYKQGQLLLNNVFQSTDINNLVYYILYTWKQLNFSQERDNLLLLGDISDRKELYETLKKYILSIEYVKDTEYIDLKNIDL